MTWETDPIDAAQISTLRWDLPTGAGPFLSVIGGPEALEGFLGLPAASLMPDDLRAALVAQGYVTADRLPPPARPVSEALLMEHPGHSDQKVHNPHKGRKGQMSMGLGGKVESLSKAVSSGSSYSIGRNPEIEQRLMTGTITDIQEVGGGHVSACYRAKLYNETTGDFETVYLKPSDGMSDELGNGSPGGMDHENEMASYLVSSELGIVQSPVCVIRTGLPEVNGYTSDRGAFITSAKTRWVVMTEAGAGHDREGSLYDLDSDQQVRAAVFDTITGACDRHGSNMKVWVNDDGGYEFAALDNGSAFPPSRPTPWNYDVIEAGAGKALSTPVYEAVAKFVRNRDRIEPELAALVGADAARQAFARASYIADTGMTLDVDEYLDAAWEGEGW